MTSVPSEAAGRVSNDLCYEFIIETCDLAESYARSASAAAWRGDRMTLSAHLMQLRTCVIAALKTYNEISVAEGEKAAAA
jgi:hypothetical protein